MGTRCTWATSSASSAGQARARSPARLRLAAHSPPRPLPARSILLAERVVLNFMQRMSGIATLTAAMTAAAKPARVLETRKTAPGLRVVDKWVSSAFTRCRGAVRDSRARAAAARLC